MVFSFLTKKKDEYFRIGLFSISVVIDHFVFLVCAALKGTLGQLLDIFSDIVFNHLGSRFMDSPNRSVLEGNILDQAFGGWLVYSFFIGSRRPKPAKQEHNRKHEKQRRKYTQGKKGCLRAVFLDGPLVGHCLDYFRNI
jgi:hypothetical protein